MRFVIGYVATLLSFCILDFVWLGGIAKGFYQSRIGGLLLAQPNWAAAVLFYLLFATGMQIFCVAPALDAGSSAKAALFGALFGFFCYMTYDLSNLATLKDWSAPLPRWTLPGERSSAPSLRPPVTRPRARSTAPRSRLSGALRHPRRPLRALPSGGPPPIPVPIVLPAAPASSSIS